jgi:hypothetical protein
MTHYQRIELPALETQHYSQMRPFDFDLLRELIGHVNNLDAILNRGFSFMDNADARIVSFTSNGVANTEETVAHTLGKVPTGFLVCNLDKAASIYSGPTAWTKTNIYLKSNTASTTASIIVF